MIPDLHAYYLPASVFANLILFIILTRRQGKKIGARVVYEAWLWTGGRFTPVPIKPGQIELKWERPDGSKTAFALPEEWRIPVGERGSVWLINATNGDLYKPTVPDATEFTELGPEDLVVKDGKVNWTAETAVFRPNFEVRALHPNNDYLRTVIDDKREQKWMRALAAEETKANMKKLVLMAIAGLVIFLVVKNGGFGGNKESVINLFGTLRVLAGW